MANEIENTSSYWISLIQAIADGRIEERTLVDMTPEARQQFHDRIVGEEKAEIAEGLEMHETSQETPE